MTVSRSKVRVGPREGFVALDSPWSWVVSVASAWIDFWSYVLFRSSGVLFVAVVSVMGVSRGQASWPFSLVNTLYQLMGPITGVLIMKGYIKSISILGTFLSVAAAFLCFVKFDYTSLLVFIPLAGIGQGLCTPVNSVLVNQFFDRYLSSASGISLTGITLASFVFPPVVTLLLETYGLRGTFLIISGLSLHAVAGALLTRPPPWMFKRRRSESLPLANGDSDKLHEKHSEDTFKSSTTVDEETASSKLGSMVSVALDATAAQVVALADHDSNEETEKKASKNNDEIVIYEMQRRDRSPVYQSTVVTLPRSSVLQLPVPKGSSWMKKVRFFKKPFYYIITVHWISSSYVNFCFLVSLVDLALSIGVDSRSASMVLSAYSVGDLAGRLLSGWISDKRFLSRPSVMMLNCGVLSAVLFLVPHCNTYSSLVLASVAVGWCVGSCVILFTVLLGAVAGLENLSLAIGVTTFFLGIATLARPTMIGPVAGIVSKVWPKTLLVMSCIVSAVALACSYLIFGLLSWTLLLGLLFGASVGATKTACVLIVNACFKQYRSIGNGLSISGEAVAVYLGGPLISKLTNEYGVKGMFLVMSGVMLNAAVIAFFISRFTFDASEGPGEELLPLDSKSDVDLANKVIMEEAPVADEEKDLLKVPVERWPESLSDIMSRERRKTNIVECVAVIEHQESDSESDDALSWSGSELQDWRSSGETSAKDDAVNSPKVPWRSFSKDSDQSRLLKRRSWHNDEVDVKRRRSFLERWVSSSIESLRLARQAEKTYTKLKDSEDSPPSDINVSSRDTSTSRGNVTNVSTVPATDAISTISSHSKLSSENQIQFHPPDGCVVQNADLLSVVENFPPEKSSNGTDAPGPIPAIVLEDAFSSGLSRSNTELSLENGDLSRNAALLSSLDQLALTVPGAPLKRRYSRLAQDIIIRQLQDKRRQERCGGHLNIFSNPTLYLICVANSVMFNSVVIFLTKLSEVLQMKSIPATLEDRLMPTFCIGNLAACLCSGWFTDEGHISVRRAIAVDFFILGGSMLIVSLHNSVNTFAVQSLLQGWAFGQSKALAPVLLVDTLGVGSCGLAYGVVSFATGVSALIGQLLVVHFRDSYGTQDFIFNFHGILALAIAGMFLVETRFNRALVRKRRPRAQEL